MPQNVEFTVPFPRRINPDLAGARERNLHWVRRWGLVCGEEAQRRYLYSQVADLAAYAYPDERGEDLDLSFDVTGYFFLLDDQFDIPMDQHPSGAVAACEELIALLFRSPAPVPASASPLVAAYADLWQRMTDGMSEHWRARATNDWAEYLAGNLTEVADRRGKAALDTDSHIRSRRRTIGVRPSLALAERAGRFEVPTLAYHSSHLETMRVITVDAIILVNEVFSLEKDEARGDANLVHCLMRDRQYTRHEAIDALRVMADALPGQFLDLEHRLPQLCDDLALSASERISVHRYADAMRAWIRGNYDWSLTNGRYSPRAVRQTARDQSGYLNVEDLVTRSVTADDTDVRDAAHRFAQPLEEPPSLLRHAHATELINDGVPIEVVRRRLGHASTETTQLADRGADFIKADEPDRNTAPHIRPSANRARRSDH